jgi:hypothetical protein
MKRKVLLGAAILAVGSTALVSCGGGASSSSGSGTPVASLQKDAVVTVSYPTSSNLSSQILSDDTKAIEVVFYQVNPADSNGVVGGYDESGKWKDPIMYETSVVLTPSNPTQTLSLFPTDTVVCINQLDKDPNDKTSTSQPNVLSSFCSYAGLQKGNNNLTYTLLRGVWSLPSGSDINGYTQFAITNMGYYSYYYPTYYYGTYFDYYLYYTYDFRPLASKDGSTWNSSNYVEGVYANQLYQNGGTLLALASKKSDGSYDAFAALKDIVVDTNGAKYVDRYVDPVRFEYSCNYNNGTCYGQKYVKVERTLSFKVLDKSGNDVTSSILNTCKFSSTDGKSITGCLAKNVKEEVSTADNAPPANYTYKVVATVTTVGPSICNANTNYIYKDGKCLNMNYSYDWQSNTYTCLDNGYTYNSTTGYCEGDLKTTCENSGGAFDSNTNTCTQTITSYLSLTATQTTLTGSTKFPASTQITVQKK